MSRQDLNRASRSYVQQEVLCRNKDQVELKLENKTLSRHVTTLSQHKELKVAEKLCHERRQLCHNAKFKVSNGRQDNFVTTGKFYVSTNIT